MNVNVIVNVKRLCAGREDFHRLYCSINVGTRTARRGQQPMGATTTNRGRARPREGGCGISEACTELQSDNICISVHGCWRGDSGVQMG